MYIHQLSLTNQIIRTALKQFDSKAVTASVLLLVNGDENKADQLADWFRAVADSCKKGEHMTSDIAMMRMWQIGNVDIKGIEEDGEPIFVLTYSGSEIVKEVPKDKVFHALLFDKEAKSA